MQRLNFFVQNMEIGVLTSNINSLIAPKQDLIYRFFIFETDVSYAALVSYVANQAKQETKIRHSWIC